MGVAAVLARPVVPFAILPIFAVLLVAGTVAQRYVGLYAAQQAFFVSPPALALLGLLTLSLFCKFVFFSPWTRARAGINLAHLGILVLLAGGFITGISAREGHLTIAEGAKAQDVTDYHIRELVVTDTQTGTRTAHGFTTLTPGQRISLPGSATVEILSTCRNCTIAARSETNDDLRGMARFMQLVPAAARAQDEENIAGATFRISGADDAEQDGLYILFDPTPKPAVITSGGHALNLVMDRQKRALPFVVALNDFEADYHPGTQTARTYHSDVVIHDGDVAWPARIAMNEPLRYKGYTLFQSSFFVTQDGREHSVLAVVDNTGWIFPYIGTGLMAIGLLAHLIIMTARRKRREHNT